MAQKTVSGFTAKGLELLERIIYKSADDVALSIARSFERLEKCIDAVESRLYLRLGDLEHQFERETSKNTH